MSKVIIIGSGSFAEFVCYSLINDSQHEIVAACSDRHYNNSKSYFKAKKIALIDPSLLVSEYPESEFKLFIAIGNNVIRKDLFEHYDRLGYEFISYVSTKCTSWDDLEIRPNVFVDQGCMIHPFVEIGCNSILINSRVGHHSVIGKNVLLSVTTTGGNVNIGDNTFIGMRSTVKQGISIGSNNIIGMSSVIKHDTQDYSVYAQESTKRRIIINDVKFERFLP